MAENNAKTARGRPFQKGQSGNPGGRPKLRELVRERSAKAVDEHVVEAWIDEVVKRGDDWVKCSELLAAYGIGKPQSAPEDLDAVEKAGARASSEVVIAALEGLCIRKGEQP